MDNRNGMCTCASSRKKKRADFIETELNVSWAGKREKWRDIGQRVKAFSYKNKFRGSNVQGGDYG